MFFSAVDFRYFIKPCKRSAIQPVSQRRDEREAISLGLAIPTNATAFSKHKIYFIIKVIYSEKAGKILRNLHLTFVLCSASQK